MSLEILGEDVDGGGPGGCLPPLTRAVLADGGHVLARRVLVGIGSTNIPRMPSWAAEARESLPLPSNRMLHSWEITQLTQPHQQQAAAHACDDPNTCNSDAEPRGIKDLQTSSESDIWGSLVLPSDHVCIVGGGLTAAQLARCAAKAGAAKITILMRGFRKVHQFDVTNHYMGRLRGEHLEAFQRMKSFKDRLKVRAGKKREAGPCLMDAM